MATKITKKSVLAKAENFVKQLKTRNDDELGALFNIIADELEARNVFDDNDIHVKDFEKFMPKATDEELKKFTTLINKETQRRNK